LIKSGAMDEFGNRASLLIAMPDIVSKANMTKKQEAEGQGSLFGDEPIEMNSTNGNHQEVDDFTKEEKLMFEKEFLGFYLTSHPHSKTLQIIKQVSTHEIEFLESEQEGTIVKIG